MALKEEESSITVRGTKTVIGPTETGNIISPNEWVCDPLKSTSTFSGLRRLSGLYLSCSKVGKYSMSVALPRSIKMRFIKCFLTSKVRTRASL